jgi:3-polyprenyl-4-hydroxybenzoate decarboxylase
MYTLRVAIRQRVPGEARNAIAACFGAITNVKHVFVVDPDIDIFSDEEMDWAFATRFQADRDLMVMADMRAVPIDPSLMGRRTGAKAGFDLTWPPGATAKLELQVPAPPTLKGKRFPSIAAALADGPKFFEELMAAVGSRDGREVVRALEDLRANTAIERDAEGRYSIKG